MAGAVDPPWEPVRTRRSRPAPREGTSTWLGARLPDLGVLPLRTRAPILLWFMPLRAALAFPSPRWLRIGRMTSLVRPPVARLAMRGLPGPRTSHCLLLGLEIRTPRPMGADAGADEPERRDGSGDESMPPANPRASSPVHSGDVPMVGCDGDGATPTPGKNGNRGIVELFACVYLLPVDGRRQKRFPRWGRGQDPRAVTAHG